MPRARRTRSRWNRCDVPQYNSARRETNLSQLEVGTTGPRCLQKGRGLSFLAEGPEASWGIIGLNGRLNGTGLHPMVAA